MRGIAACLLLAAMTSGCAGAPPPTPIVVFVTPPASEEATPSPTKNVTPAPTLARTPTPSSFPSGTPFAVFKDHVDVAIPALASAGETGTPEAIQAYDLELEWLAEHPPQTCYVDAYSLWEQTNTASQAANWATRDEEWDLAVASLDKALSALDQFAALMNDPQTCAEPPAGGSSTPSSPPSGDGATIDQLQPFVPSAIWETCISYDTSYRTTITQGAYCSYDGVDGVWFDLYGSAADLKAAFAEDVETFKAKPDSANVSCAEGGNVTGTWTWTHQTGNHPDQGLLCYKDPDGQAWIEQVDPTINVMFSALLESGNQAALYKWWLENDSVIEPGS